MNCFSSLSSTVASIAIAAALVACGGNTASEGVEVEGALGTSPSARTERVAGFDFSGVKRADGLPARHGCAQTGTGDLLVTDACLAAGGRTIYTSTCATLCSVPVAPKGKIAGYGMIGLQTEDGLAEHEGCPEVGIDDSLLVSDACIAARGRTAFTKTCATLCSVPVAPAGHVAGYNFTSFRKALAIPAHAGCPESGGDAIAITDACMKAHGKTVWTKACQVLCSVPVAH